MTAAEFKARFIPHTAAMYRTAFRLTGNVQEAEDMVQEAFIRLWQRRDRIPEADDTAAYCTTLTRNVCVDAMRRKRLDTSGAPPEALPLTDGHDAAHAIEAEETERQLEQAIGRLPGPQQRVVRMRHLDDRSISDIQTETGYTAGNIRQLLSRARRQLKTLLSHDNNE